VRRAEFERVVKEALNGLPETFQHRIRNLAVVIEDTASADLLAQLGLEHPHELLGLYQGVSLDKRGFYYGNVLPDRISLYKKPIEAQCRSKQEMIRLIQEVVLHEVGHYFGLDDQALEKILSESD
jgi:predicted Zn-dependent protease with MMP-like domain